MVKSGGVAEIRKTKLNVVEMIVISAHKNKVVSENCWMRQYAMFQSCATSLNIMKTSLNRENWVFNSLFFIFIMRYKFHSKIPTEAIGIIDFLMPNGYILNYYNYDKLQYISIILTI